MATDRQYTAHQKGVIRRYYEHKPDLQSQRLGELVSDLYLETSKAGAQRKWKSVETLLTQLGVSPAKVRRIVAARDLTALAQIVGELF
jgi:hypothetical protein